MKKGSVFIRGSLRNLEKVSTPKDVTFQEPAEDAPVSPALVGMHVCRPSCDWCYVQRFVLLYAFFGFQMGPVAVGILRYL